MNAIQHRVLLGVAAVLVAAGVVAAVVHKDDDRGIAKAENIAQRDDQWATAEDSANTMIAIALLLRSDAETCATERSANAPECRPLFAGSAHAQAGSIGLLRCSRVELFDAREAMREYLVALDNNPTRARLPQLPFCS